MKIFAWSKQFAQGIVAPVRRASQNMKKKPRMSATFSGQGSRVPSPMASSPSVSSPYLNVPASSSSVSFGSAHYPASPYLFPHASSSSLSVASMSSLPLAPHSLSRQASNLSFQSGGSPMYQGSNASSSSLRSAFSGSSAARARVPPPPHGALRPPSRPSSVRPPSSKASTSSSRSVNARTRPAYTPPSPALSGRVMLSAPSPAPLPAPAPDPLQPTQPKRADGKPYRSASSIHSRNVFVTKAHDEREKQAQEIKADPSKRSFDIFRKNASPKHRWSLYGAALQVKTFFQRRVLGHQTTAFANNPLRDEDRGKDGETFSEQVDEDLFGEPPDDSHVTDLIEKGYTYVCTGPDA